MASCCNLVGYRNPIGMCSRLCCRKLVRISKVTFLQQRSCQASLSKWKRCGLIAPNQPDILPHYTVFFRQQSTDTVHPHLQEGTSLGSNPYKLVEDQLLALPGEIKKVIHTKHSELKNVANYYFDGKGKAFRPMIVMLMSKACNYHHFCEESICHSQHTIAMISEMIHTASLLHDDVIDGAHFRRGKASANFLWGQRKAILAADFILSMASMALAQLQSEHVVSVITCVIEDLVKGEFMQLGSKEDQSERFSHYLKKTFKKTASLMANSCKAVAILGNCCEEVSNIAYQYGKNIGMAFQLVDDVLDFVSSDQILGKPTATDLRLGLATAPVLFAAQEFAELNPMIMRRFSHSGDVERARELVEKSDGVGYTRCLAEQHSKTALKFIGELRDSPSRGALITIVNMVLKRKK